MGLTNGVDWGLQWTWAEWNSEEGKFRVEKGETDCRRAEWSKDAYECGLFSNGHGALFRFPRPSLCASTFPEEQGACLTTWPPASTPDTPVRPRL